MFARAVWFNEAAEVGGAVSVFERLEEAESDWRALLQIAPVSPYQTYEMQATWTDTIGRADGLEPFIVIERDASGKATALLPFAIARHGPLRIARFIGKKESNFNLGLFAAGIYDRASAKRLLMKAASQSAKPPDLYYLCNMPRRFDGVDSPLAFDDARDSPSFGYGRALPDRPEDLAQGLSKDARKKLRKKEARLAQMGPLAFEHCPSGSRAREILDVLIAQKTARFAAIGVTPLARQPGMRAFLERVVDIGALELHALSLGERIIAVYAGFARNGRFSAMLNSFDMDEDIARSSPGDLLLHDLMRNLVARGFTHFDLGAGEARYKDAVCGETIVLCDAIVPVTAAGRIAAPVLAYALQGKRRVKQSPALSHALARLRKIAG